MEREAVLGGPGLGVDREVLHGLQIEPRAGHGGRLGPQAIHDVLERAALAVGLQVDQHSAARERGRVRAVDADVRAQAFDVGIRENLFRDRLLDLAHRRERHGLACADVGLDLPRVLRREQSLRDHDVEQRRERERRNGDDEHRRAGGRAPSAASAS